MNNLKEFKKLISMKEHEDISQYVKRLEKISELAQKIIEEKIK